MIAVLRERSPLSMAVSLEVVTRAEGSMAEVLRSDLDLTRSSFEQGDAVEGVRAHHRQGQCAALALCAH